MALRRKPTLRAPDERDGAAESETGPPSGWLAVGTPAHGHRDQQTAAASQRMSLTALEMCFERALAQIDMHFQPIVRTCDGSVLGFEALMRSSDADLPHPGAMLDAAEKLHRTERLGRQVRRRVANRFSVAADDLGLVFVNLHALDLLDRSLASPYSPLSKLRHRVVLEITERASLATVADARYRIARLREMGFRIAIDDLGAGHARLEQFTLSDTDFVKLDMSLVRDIDSHQGKRRCVETILTTCRERGIQVVGEGVETEAERRTLAELGCDLLQGYLIARPAPDPIVPSGL